MSERIREKVIFEGPNQPDRGYTVKATDLEDIETSRGDALIEIFKEGELVRSFVFPAYKVWNIVAHFGDIVDGEIANHDAGYRKAAWDGISPMEATQPLPEKSRAPRRPGGGMTTPKRELTDEELIERGQFEECGSNGVTCDRIASTARQLATRLEAALTRVEELERCGIIKLSLVNVNVGSFMRKKEARIAALTKQRDDLKAALRRLADYDNEAEDLFHARIILRESAEPKDKT
ncbi:MAG: hypothetical protein ACREI9_12715 [Nitrospiraceae bacterium]